LGVGVAEHRTETIEFPDTVPVRSKPSESELGVAGQRVPLVSALGLIARAVSGTLELKDVFVRVGEVAATVLPFDAMGLARAEGAATLTAYSYYSNEEPADDAQGEKPRTLRLGDFSPAIRPVSADTRRFDDLTGLLDPSFSVDRMLLAGARRSLLFVPLRRSDEVTGFVHVSARRAAAFTPEHETALRAIADLLGVALEHERLWNLDTVRRRRLEAIDALLPVMANVLDVREIFNQISEVVRPVLPHDRLILTSVDADRRIVTVDAISGEPVPDLAAGIPMSGPGCAKAAEYKLVQDVEAEPEMAAGRCERLRALGVRSLLGIPLRLEGDLIGSLVLASRTPAQYSEEDVVVARRVADHVSLALSHQRLAEEQRRTAEARQRASQLEDRVVALRRELETTLGHRRVIGESEEWRDVLTQAAKVAATETTVLLTGESGTGKEVVARMIHRGSPRADSPFIALNCAALPETLLESELFGHEKGAFTGATAARAGRIEQASGGVLFLDEVGEMSPAVQAKLLRVLQEREFQRLGGARPIQADVRVVAATNRDLKTALARGQFREDLYYRLCVFEIGLPALRERRQDILPMAAAFLAEIGLAVGRPVAGISREAREALVAYGWPGNVRELRNVLERATILCDGGLVGLEHLPVEVGRRSAPVHVAAAPAALPSGGVDLSFVERDLIARALGQAKNNRSQAARLLGITRSQLYSRMHKHGLGIGPARAAE
jgi:transcriptional regulator with GAF, ATPase, and Fis domain